MQELAVRACVAGSDGHVIAKQIDEWMPLQEEQPQLFSQFHLVKVASIHQFVSTTLEHFQRIALCIHDAKDLT